jgi:hypothetical protein
MSEYAALALAKQAFDELLTLCAPEEVRQWQPSAGQRAAFIRLAEKSLRGYVDLRTRERHELLAEARMHSMVPETLLTFAREQIGPRADAIRGALNHLDPERAFFYDLLYGESASGTSTRVLRTFEEGIEQIYHLLERNPEWEYDHPFSPDEAYSLLTSKLIGFEPDAWLGRASELESVRTHRRNFDLPMQVRLRLEELCRAYVFGLWLSVSGLARAILEYSIIDNLAKLHIERTWPPDRKGTRKEKRLADLIDEVAEALPDLKTPMMLLRDRGNEYLHPRKSRISKESLLQRKESAKAVVAALVSVIEAIYLAREAS